MEAITDWIVIAGVAILLTIVVASWLASYRMPRTAPVRSGDWFFVLPVWAQIVGGLAACKLLASLGYWLWIPLPLALAHDADAILRIVGLALFLVGWALVLWARWTLGTLYGVSTSFAAPLQAQHRLIQHGPYARVRHPMYLGYWLLLAGVMLIFRTWTPFLFFVICLASFYRRARREELALAERFGAAWHAYAARTGFLVPSMRPPNRKDTDA